MFLGEANTSFNSDLYSCTFWELIRSWRQRWSSNAPSTEPDFPFGFVQLSTNDITNCTGVPALRWHQTYDQGFVPNEPMEVILGLYSFRRFAVIVTK